MSTDTMRSPYRTRLLPECLAFPHTSVGRSLARRTKRYASDRHGWHPLRHSWLSSFGRQFDVLVQQRGSDAWQFVLGEVTGSLCIGFPAKEMISSDGTKDFVPDLSEGNKKVHPVAILDGKEYNEVCF